MINDLESANRHLSQSCIAYSKRATNYRSTARILDVIVHSKKIESMGDAIENEMKKSNKWNEMKSLIKMANAHLDNEQQDIRDTI
jgi:hypothetical protein